MESNPKLFQEIIELLNSICDDETKLKRALSILKDEIELNADDDAIPDQYRDLVSSIADSLNAGLVCFLNPENFEVEEVFQDFLEMDPEELEFTTGEKPEDYKHESWTDYIMFEPPDSNESYRMMESFSDNLDDKQWKEKLIQALDKKHPFANFNHLINSSPYRQEWFDYKKQIMERTAFQQLMAELSD